MSYTDEYVTEIDFKYNGVNIAFHIIFENEYHTYTYTSPFIFRSTEDAKDSALQYLAKK
jgi:hypothetical protein